MQELLQIHRFHGVQTFIPVMVALLTIQIEVVTIMKGVVVIPFLLTSISAKSVINGVIWQLTAIIALIYNILVNLLLNIKL